MDQIKPGNKPLIGFIGQGWIGKNYANDFENRGFKTVRYSKEEPYVQNESKIKECDIVFIAVPTPTTKNGFDGSIVKKVLSFVGEGKIAVIKSTMLPGTTKELQAAFPKIFILHSPEFLSESTAAKDAAEPKRNIVGVPAETKEYLEKAEAVMKVLPKAPYNKICGSTEAEIVKYGRNISGFMRVIVANIFYDLTKKIGGNWEEIREMISADPDTGPTYLNPVHKSGRGAGGHCYIKDFAAFQKFYEEHLDDPHGMKVLEAVVEKNIKLLLDSGKDIDLLKGVYGEDVMNN